MVPCRVLFIHLILILSAIISVSTKSTDEYWTLENQMKTEERPYTATSSATIPAGYRSAKEVVLVPQFREMHGYCDGQCFYGPATCATNPEKLLPDCEVAASVAQHSIDTKGDLYCDTFGEDALRKHFCYVDQLQSAYRNKSGKNDKFYTITLQHNLPSTWTFSCPHKWNEVKGRPCRRTEFIGIAFVKDGGGTQQVNEEELWYLCTVDESYQSRISMFTKLQNPGPGTTQSTATRIKETQPHHDSGAGVIFSKIYFDNDFTSFGCQFVIQESTMALKGNQADDAAYFGTTQGPIKVKLITGQMHRPDKYIRTPDIEKVYMGAELKPTDVIDFDALQVVIQDTSGDIPGEKILEENASSAMEELLKKCQKAENDDEDRRIKCYTPTTKENCIWTGRCNMLFAIEEDSGNPKTIRAHLYSLLPDTKNQRKVLRPVGFAAVGFSKDDHMGSDVVVHCHAYGPNTTIHLSINYGHANIYPGKVDYDHLLTKKKTYQTQERGRVLCSWNMPTKFRLNLVDYAPDYKEVIKHLDLRTQNKMSTLEVDFRKTELFLLLAAGSRNYANGIIVHHDVHQILGPYRFTKGFFQKESDSRSRRLTVPSLKLLLLLVVFQVFLFT